MPSNFGNNSGTNIELKPELAYEYVLKHGDQFRDDLFKVFGYVGENKSLLKPYIDEQIVSSIRLWVSEGLGVTYEDVAIILDEESLKKFLGEEWFNI